MLLTSRLTLTPTSLSRNTFGSTSSLSPTSRYVTDSDTPTLAVAVVVITGTRSPIRICALLRFFTRIRGLARMLVSPFSARRFTDGLSMPMLEPRILRSRSAVSCVVVRVLFCTVVLPVAVDTTVAGFGTMFSSVNLPGVSTPISVKRERLTSSTSTSSSTSGSARSCSAISLPASAMAAGVSRMVRLLSFSSACRSLVFSTVFSIVNTALASALAR